MKKLIVSSWPTSPTKDPVFMVLEGMLDKCRESEDCSKFPCREKRQCERWFNRVSELSADHLLSDKEAKELVKQFHEINPKLP